MRCRPAGRRGHPAEHPVRVPVQVVRLGHAIEQHFDVGPRGRILGHDVESGPEDPALVAVRLALLRPVEEAAFRIDGDAHGVLSAILAVLLRGTGLDVDGQIRTGGAAAHHAQALAVAPVEPAALSVERDLLAGDELPDRHDDRDRCRRGSRARCSRRSPEVFTVADGAHECV